MKLCKGCGNFKELTEFRVDNSRKDGRQSRCKICKGKREKETLPTGFKRCGHCISVLSVECFNKDKSTNDGYCSWCKKCVSDHQKQYRAENQEVIRQKKHDYHQVNKEWINAKNKIYQETHKDEIQEYKQQWAREQYANDLNYRIGSILRARLHGAMKRNQKIGSAVQDLGCSIDELKQHLEAQFYPHPETGEVMTWENYGLYGWHIDHIQPLDSFDLRDREQFLKAVHYTNLQPLWACDNLRKGARVIHAL